MGLHICWKSVSSPIIYWPLCSPLSEKITLITFLFFFFGSLFVHIFSLSFLSFCDSSGFPVWICCRTSDIIFTTLTAWNRTMRVKSSWIPLNFGNSSLKAAHWDEFLKNFCAIFHVIEGFIVTGRQQAKFYSSAWRLFHAFWPSNCCIINTGENLVSCSMLEYDISNTLFSPLLYSDTGYTSTAGWPYLPGSPMLFSTLMFI